MVPSTSRRRPLASDESGVSEIVGSSLILAITVVLFSVIILWVATLDGPDEKRFVDLDASLTVTGAGGTVTITHSGGESLRDNLTFVQLILNSTVSNLNLSSGGVGAKWEMGETWTYSTASIGTTTRVELRVIEESNELNQILLIMVLQTGTLGGANDPAIHLTWSDPDTITADGASVFSIKAYATDVDGNLGLNQAGKVDLSPVGGSASQKLSDPDGDGTYTTAALTVPQNITAGLHKLTLTFTDASARTAMAKVVLKVSAVDLVYARSDTLQALEEPTAWSTTDDIQAAGGGSSYTALDLGDVDLDGDRDVAAGTAGGAVHYYPNNATWPQTVVAGLGSQINELLMVDLDGDTKTEIVVGTADGRVIEYNLRSGAWVATTLDNTLGAVHALATADMDGDLDTDVVAGTATKVEWISNDGGGVWTLQTPIDNAVGAQVHSLALGAFDASDANTDVVAGTNGDIIYLYASGGAWTRTALDGNVGNLAQVEALVAVDLEGDGDLDIVAGTNGSVVISYLRTGAASSAWTKRTVDGAAGGGAAGIVGLDIVEVDGDGNLDIVVAAGTRLHWYANDQLWTRTTITTLAGNAGALALGEVSYRV